MEAWKFRTEPEKEQDCNQQSPNFISNSFVLLQLSRLVDFGK